MDEAELLEKALPVFDDYIRAAVQVGSDHTIDASILRPYASEREIDTARRVQAQLETAGERMEGSASITKAVVQEKAPDAGSFALLICQDLRDLRIVNEDGEDVTSVARGSSSTAQVTFSGWPDAVRVERNVEWTGTSVC